MVRSSLGNTNLDTGVSVDAKYGFYALPVAEMLKLKLRCYEKEEPCKKYNIVDEKGEMAGYATFVEKMLQQLVEGGASYFPQHALRAIAKQRPDDTSILNFDNGASAKADVVILNVPQRPLLSSFCLIY